MCIDKVKGKIKQVTGNRNKDFARILALLGASIVVGAGCVARTQGSIEAQSEAPVVFTEEPTLVEVDGGVWVVRDSEYPVYFVDDDYWVYRNDVWYRSHSYDGGWVVVEAPVVPVVVVHRDHRLYVRYHGVATAQTRSAPRRQGEPERRAEPERRTEPERAGPPVREEQTKDRRPEERGEERKEERREVQPARAEPPGEHGGRAEPPPAKVKKRDEKKRDEKKGGTH
jgi:hypothetical protein